MRFCVDYRRLRLVTKMDVFPLPRTDATLHRSQGTQVSVEYFLSVRKLARMGLAVQEVKLSIFYHPGKKNVLADALSQSPLSENVLCLLFECGPLPPYVHLTTT